MERVKNNNSHLRFLAVGKVLGYTVFSVTNSDKQNIQLVDFRFYWTDLLLLVAHFCINLLIFYFGVVTELIHNTKNVNASVGYLLVVSISMFTGIISSCIIIAFRHKLLRILQLFQLFDLQVCR